MVCYFMNLIRDDVKNYIKTNRQFCAILMVDKLSFYGLTFPFKLKDT